MFSGEKAVDNVENLCLPFPVIFLLFSVYVNRLLHKKSHGFQRETVGFYLAFILQIR